MTLPLTQRPVGALGTPITPANSAAGGNPFDIVGSGVTYGPEHHRLGQCAVCTQGGTPETQMMQWSSTSTGTLLAGSTVWTRWYHEISALPSVNLQVWQIRHSTLGACAGARINANGTVSVMGSAGSALATSAAVVPVGQIIRVEARAVLGAVVAGSVEVSMWWSTSADFSGPDARDEHACLTVTASGVDTRGDGTHLNVGLVTASTSHTHRVWDVHASSSRPPLRWPATYRRVGIRWVPA